MEKLKNEIYSLLDNSQYVEAKMKVTSIIKDVDKKSEDYYPILAEMAGFLIDIGNESKDRDATEYGLRLLNENKANFEKFFSPQSYYYCIANAYHSLNIIENKSYEKKSIESFRKYHFEEKRFYFKAFKEIDFQQISEIDLQVLTNLANSLSDAGRVIEAIRLYRIVLGYNDSFSHALFGFSMNIDCWIRDSVTPISLSLLVIIYAVMSKGVEKGELPHERIEYFKGYVLKYENLLKELKFDFSQIRNELAQNKIEYEEHSEYRKFCLDNFLALSEHSLFCNCSSSKEDDLSIIHSGIHLFGNKVGKMELILNRLKSEFIMARLLYYEGLSHHNDDIGSVYSELMDNEIIGLSSEKIRISFRLCFGILDKIAHAITNFYDLPIEKGEKISFLNIFQTHKNEKILDRWEKLKTKTNPHLIALISIASDLSNNGEFGEYKNWRNNLEHNTLILVESDTIDFLELYSDDKFIQRVSYSFFKDQALQLLQICCSAIFSFAYCVRVDSLENNGDGPMVPYVIHPKGNY